MDGKSICANTTNLVTGHFLFDAALYCYTHNQQFPPIHSKAHWLNQHLRVALLLSLLYAELVDVNLYVQLASPPHSSRPLCPLVACHLVHTSNFAFWKHHLCLSLSLVRVCCWVLLSLSSTSLSHLLHPSPDISLIKSASMTSRVYHSE